MRHRRKTSKRSMPVTPSRIIWTTRSTNTLTYAFSSGSTFKEEGFLTRSMEKGGSPVDCPGVGWSLQKNQVDCHPRTESGRIMVGKELFPLN